MGENVTEKEKGEPSETERNVSGGGSGTGKSGDTKIGLTLRILVSAYVLYLAYGLIQGFGEATGNDRIFIAIAIVDCGGRRCYPDLIGKKTDSEGVCGCRWRNSRR